MLIYYSGSPLLQMGIYHLKFFTEVDINFLVLKVLNVGILTAEDQHQVMHKERMKLFGILSWCLIQVPYHAFEDKYGVCWFD